MTATKHDAEELLSSIDLFSGMSHRQIKKLAKLTKTVDHESGHVVAAEGAGSLAFHLILSGEAVVTKHGQTIRRLGRGDYFGEISMIDGEPRSATVTADGPLQTLAITHTSFQELLDDEPGFARGLLVLLCMRLRAAEADH